MDSFYGNCPKGRSQPYSLCLRTESNRRPSAFQTNALPTELHRRALTRNRTPINCLQGSCSAIELQGQNTSDESLLGIAMCVVWCVAPTAGLEPAFSTVTGWRPLQLARAGMGGC